MPSNIEDQIRDVRRTAQRALDLIPLKGRGSTRERHIHKIIDGQGFLAYDSFNRSASDTIGTADSGHVWTEDQGDWELVSGDRLRVKTLGADTVVTLDVGSQDVGSVVTRINTASTTASNIDSGIVFRYVDISNFLLARIRGSGSDQLQLLKKVGGSFTTLLTQSFTPSTNTNYWLFVTFDGPIVRLEVTDDAGAVQTALVYDVIADTFTPFMGATKVGLRNDTATGADSDEFMHFVARLGNAVATSQVTATTHTALTGVTASQHHNQSHTDDDHTDSGSYNGSFLEPSTFVVTSNGTTITGTLDKNPSGDLTERFSDGYSTFSSGGTVSLIAGGDTAPKKNFIYILQSDKGVLVASDSDWPSAEHIAVAEVIVQTASTVQTEGPLVNRFWNDFAKGTDGQGHHLHAWARLRFEHSAWRSGVAITWTIDSVPSPDTVNLALTAGKVYQLHLQSVESKNTAGGDNVHVVNDKNTPYTTITDFADLLNDNDGVSMSGKYFNLVVWSSVSSGSENEHLFVNLPSGSYNKQGDAIADVSGFTVFDIPSDFRGKAFLISRITLRHQSAGGGTWTSIQETDLRGQVPNIVAGGGTAAITTEFADSQFKIFDDGDPTRELAFQVSGISGSTTRTVTVPDTDLTLLAAEGTVAGATSQAQDFGSNGIKADAIEESTGAAGVTIDSSAGSVLIKDGSATLSSDAQAALNVKTYVSTTTPPAVSFVKTRGTEASPSNLSANDLLGTFTAQGYLQGALAGTAKWNFKQLAVGAADYQSSFELYLVPAGATFISGVTLGILSDATDVILTADAGMKLVTSSNGDITLAPNGSGTIVASADLAVTGTLSAGATTVAGSITGNATGQIGLLLQRSDAVREVISQATTDAVGPALRFEKRRGTLGSSALVESGDELGDIQFYGYYNSGNEGQGAAIIAVATENFDVAGFGSEIQFHTVDNNSTTLDERWVIENDGTLQATGAMALNTSGAAALGSVTLTTDLAVTHGGTGVSALTDHGVMLGSGTGGVTVVSPVAGPSATAGFKYLRSPDASTDAAYQEVMQTKTITVEDPTASEDIKVDFFFQAVTIREIQAVVVGTSCTIDPYHNTDRSGGGGATDILNAATAITNTTTGQNLTTFNDATIPADSHLILKTTAVTACTELSVTFRYTID